MNNADQSVNDIFYHLLTRHPELLNMISNHTGNHDDETNIKYFSQNLDYRFYTFYQKNNSDILSKLCEQYGSDKGAIKIANHPYPWPPHTYADVYSRLFGHCRQYITKVFECGIGTNNSSLESSMFDNGKPGASLRVWQDYFPNANIYGADIDRNILFNENRIRTHYMDQCDPQSIAEYWRWAGQKDFDVIIDDGLHRSHAGITLFKNSIDYLSDNGVYIIEDIGFSDLFEYKNYFAQTNYTVDFVTLIRPYSPLSDNNLIIIRKNLE